MGGWSRARRSVRPGGERLGGVVAKCLEIRGSVGRSGRTMFEAELGGLQLPVKKDSSRKGECGRNEEVRAAVPIHTRTVGFSGTEQAESGKELINELNSTDSHLRQCLPERASRDGKCLCCCGDPDVTRVE